MTTAVHEPETIEAVQAAIADLDREAAALRSRLEEVRAELDAAGWSDDRAGEEKDLESQIGSLARRRAALEAKLPALRKVAARFELIGLLNDAANALAEKRRREAAARNAQQAFLEITETIMPAEIEFNHLFGRFINARRRLVESGALSAGEAEQIYQEHSISR